MFYIIVWAFSSVIKDIISLASFTNTLFGQCFYLWNTSTLLNIILGILKSRYIVFEYNNSQNIENT